MRLSILVIDLVGYSERLAALEEQVENAGETLNRQIEQFVSHAIATAQLDTAATVLKFTGDGAILKAPNAERAHRIAVALQEASESFNQGRKTALGQRVFRVGIATGEVAEYASLSGATDHGGSTIGRAARMEAGCRPGGITVDEDTYRELPLAIRSQYSELEEVVDKNGIRYGAYRWKGHCLTRLQETLKKRLEQVASDGSMAERKLLQDLPQLQTVTRLLGWIRQPNHGSAYAIEKLRSAVLPRRFDAPDSAAAEGELNAWLTGQRKIQLERRCLVDGARAYRVFCITMDQTAHPESVGARPDRPHRKAAGALVARCSALERTPPGAPTWRGLP